MVGSASGRTGIGPLMEAIGKGGHVETRDVVYEPPELAEIGDFSKVTLGPPEIGSDWSGYCWFIDCPD
jgi:hypothetical protein